MSDRPDSAEAWIREIAELHQFFESYFLGTADSLERFETVLAPDFTMAGPNEATASRAQAIAAVEAGHGHTSSLVIETSEHTLLAAGAELVAASYIESHRLADRTNHRRSTVVFRRHQDAPNGLQWVRVHENWIDRGLIGG